MKQTFLLSLIILLLIMAWAHPVSAQNQSPAVLREVGIDQKLNEQLPLDLIFRNEAGENVPLSSYFSDRPVILVFVFYQCPMLCNMILNGLVRCLNTISFNAGEHFDVVVVSFDAREGAQLAAAKKRLYLERYRRHNAARGWHFLTGEEGSIKRLTQTVGFRYTYDAQQNQFAHASGLIVLTPEARVSRYFYGIEYSSRDLRLGLVEASAHKIGSPVDQLLLLCYHYDPTIGKYSPIVINLVRVGGVVTVLTLGGLILMMLRLERKREHKKGAGAG
ncbi:MAG: SCO family protein [Acidobacteriota bacterium]